MDLKIALKPMKLKLLNDLKLNNIFCQFNNPVMNHPSLECHSPPPRLQLNTMWSKLFNIKELFSQGHCGTFFEYWKDKHSQVHSHCYKIPQMAFQLARCHCSCTLLGNPWSNKSECWMPEGDSSWNLLFSSRISLV